MHLGNSSFETILKALGGLPENEKKEVLAFAAAECSNMRFVPNPGPQTSAYYSEADELLFGGEAGGGKLSPVDSPVLTPFGWKPIGELRVGSRICATDGTAQEVIAVHPQGVKDIYRVTMRDGGSIEVGAEHLWLAWPVHKACKKGNELESGASAARKFTTQQMIDEFAKPPLKDRPRAFGVPVTKPVAFNVAGGLIGPSNFVGRPVDPYFLGLLIGDGSMVRGGSIGLTSMDDEIAAYLAILAQDDLRRSERDGNKASSFRFVGEFRKKLAADLAGLGLLGHRAGTKAIPKQYLLGDVPTRWALIQGLMDTDGWVEPQRACYYTTISKQLAEDFVFLARSLGGITSVSEKQPTYSSASGEKLAGQVAYCVRVRIDEPARLFRLERKRAIAAEIRHQSAGRFIEKIEFSRRAEAVCITVSHSNSLYIGDDFIVTHNSQLLIGVGLNEHKRSRILRRINQDAVELGDALLEILGSDEGFTRNPPTWRGPSGKLMEFRGCELERDKQRFKGKARDFIGYDELADFLESQYVFINTWNRSVDSSQRCRIIGATNGPTTAEGMWITRRWAPWLDPKHPNPAKDGELRWYLTIEGNDVEVDGPGPHEVRGKMVRATSRSFIRSRLEDNPDLARTNYGDRLESLPEELRRVYREGDFTVGLKDDDWQVIPTAWIEAAQQRWTALPPEGYTMTAMAVDVAPGGGDKRVIARRYGGWFPRLDVAREEDKDGRLTAAAVVKLRRDNCSVIVDLGGGWGGDAAIALSHNGITVVTYMGIDPSNASTRDKKLRFFNLRAESIWKLREALDPSQDGGSQIALPTDDNELKADLAAFRWILKPNGIQIESKEEIKKRIGRSPDRGESVVMCLEPGNQAVKRAMRVGMERPTTYWAASSAGGRARARHVSRRHATHTRPER